MRAVTSSPMTAGILARCSITLATRTSCTLYVTRSCHPTASKTSGRIEAALLWRVDHLATVGPVVLRFPGRLQLEWVADFARNPRPTSSEYAWQARERAPSP